MSGNIHMLNSVDIFLSKKRWKSTFRKNFGGPGPMCHLRQKRQMSYVLSVSSLSSPRAFPYPSPSSHIIRRGCMDNKYGRPRQFPRVPSLRDPPSSAEPCKLPSSKTLSTSLLPTLPASVCDHLTDMYSKLNLPSSAQLVLQLNPTRSVVCRTSLISGSVQKGHIMFVDMPKECIRPNDFHLPCLFNASGCLCMPVTGKQIHGIAIKASEIVDVFVGRRAFDMCR